MVLALFGAARFPKKSLRGMVDGWRQGDAAELSGSSPYSDWKKDGLLRTVRCELEGRDWMFGSYSFGRFLIRGSQSRDSSRLVRME